tara:strand:+ start:818 stop:1135 length:318 start_codon:yes stop_codon:yes gene_type:complete
MLENLDIVQVILIGLGIIIVVSVFLKSSKSENKPVPPPVVPPSTNPVVIKEVKEKEDHDFICLVQKWYALKACARRQGLKNVCNILDSQVFPLLNESEKPYEVKS